MDVYLIKSPSPIGYLIISDCMGMRLLTDKYMDTTFFIRVQTRLLRHKNSRNIRAVIRTESFVHGEQHWVD